MRVKLDVRERMVIPALFPKEGSYVENTVRKGAIEAVQIKEEEFKKFGMESNPEGGVKWDGEKAKDVEIELTDAAVADIKKQLKSLDENSKLTADHITLYEKFVANAPSSDEKVAGKIDKK